MSFEFISNYEFYLNLNFERALSNRFKKRKSMAVNPSADIETKFAKAAPKKTT